MGRHTSASSEAPSDGWIVQDIIDTEAAALLLSQKDKILASPPQFKDFATGQEISNVRVVEICKALDMMQKRLKAARATPQILEMTNRMLGTFCCSSVPGGFLE